jgi:hypothetical protein
LGLTEKIMCRYVNLNKNNLYILSFVSKVAKMKTFIVAFNMPCVQMISPGLWKCQLPLLYKTRLVLRTGLALQVNKVVEELGTI